MLSDRATRHLNRGTTCGVVGLAIAGFAMSYDALHALAAQHGVSAPLAWLWPPVVDGFIVVASFSVVRAVADGRRAVYPWTLVLAFSAISVTFNVVHAAPTLVARLVAAIPPAALVLSFELLMRQLRAALRPGTEPAPAAKPNLVVAPNAIALKPQRALSASSPRSPLLERARDIYTAHRRADERVTGAVLAEPLWRAEAALLRLQSAIEGAGALAFRAIVGPPQAWLGVGRVAKRAAH